MMTSTSPCPKAAERTVTILLLVVAFLIDYVQGQGLQPAPPKVGADGSYAGMYSSFDKQYKGSKTWRAAFRAAPRNACGGGKGNSSVCSAATDGASAVDTYAQLVIATSPSYYSSVDLSFTGGRTVLNQARDQRPCSTCAVFSVIAAAEAAVSSVTGRDVREVGRLSVQQLYYCGNEFRDCKAGWTIEGALQQLKETQRTLLLEECLPYAPDMRGEKTQDDMCLVEQLCRKTSPLATQGTFDYRPISELWQAQRHIRQYGAVVSRFDIYTDFKAFFRDSDNRDKVYAPKRGAQVQEPHAVALVGYDNDNQYWVARNSWGISFGNMGTFKIAFGVANVLTQGDTYGISWTPSLPYLLPPLPLTPAPKRPDCKLYKAAPTDYLSNIAWRAGIPVEKLLSDNLDVIKDLDSPLAGKSLVVCGSTVASSQLPTDSFKTPDAVAASQLAALLSVKAAVDATGGLSAWTAARGANGSYCEPGAFPGVVCDASGYVTGLVLRDVALGGGLPPGRALGRLPRLSTLQIANASVRGVLPADWAVALTQVTELHVTGNPLVTGPIPAAWGNMTQLKTLLLYENGLTGTLAPEVAAGWSSTMEVLHIGGNGLTGPLPAEWGKLRGLKTLCLFNNKLTGTLPPELGYGWAIMEDLELSTNQFTGTLPPEFGGMRRLSRLDLFENQLTGTLPPELGLSWLSMSELTMSSNQFVGTLPRAWSAMDRLKVLMLDDNKISGTLPAELSSCEAMSKLVLSKNAFTGPLPLEWSKLSELTELRLDTNRLSGTLPPKMGQGWASIEVLHLNNNQLRGPLPKLWGGMQRLKDLQLYTNQLTGTLPPEFGAGWTNIEQLEMAENQLTGPLPPEWSSWQFIQELALDTNRLTGTVPPSWGAMGRSLKLLWLSNNPGLQGCFPRPGLEAFGAVPETVSGTRLSPAAC